MINKYIRQGGIAMLLLLAGCGQSAPNAQTPAQLPTSTTRPTQVVSSPVNTEVPFTSTMQPMVTVVPTKSGASSATAQPISFGWQSVAWEGLSVSEPPTYTYEIEQLEGQNVFAALGAPIYSRMTLIPPGSPREAPARMMLEVVRWTGALHDCLDVVRQQGSEQPVLDEDSIQRVLVAGFPGFMYARDQHEPYRNYVLLRSDSLLLISLDTSDPAQIGVIDTLVTAVEDSAASAQ